jgi:hypothetical protein
LNTLTGNFPSGVNMYNVGASNISTAGYFFGGQNASAASTNVVNKLTYSNDIMTTSLTAALLGNLVLATTVTSLTDTYISGGLTSFANGYPCYQTYKMPFATEVVAVSVVSNLSIPRSGMTGVQCQVGSGAVPTTTTTTMPPLLPGGYIMGGWNNAAVKTNAAVIIDFGTEVASNLPSANLPAAIYWASGVANKNNGYVCGGNSTATISAVSRTNFGTRSTSSLGNILPYPVEGAQSTVSSVAGYLAGGTTNGGTFNVLSVIKLFYSTETAYVSPISQLPALRAFGTGNTNSANAGYFFGGYTGGTPYLNNAVKLTFSSEVSSILASTFSASVSSGAWGSGLTSVYYYGGTTSPSAATDLVRRMPYATELITNLLSVMPYGEWLTTVVSSANANYVCGGYNPSYGTWNYTYKMPFSTDITSVCLLASLPDQNSVACGFQSVTNNPTTTTTTSTTPAPTGPYGLVLGGSVFAGSSQAVATAEKFDFGTEMCAYSALSALPIPVVSVGNTGFSAGGNGYISGGYGTSNQLLSEYTYKTNFAYETSSVVPNGGLSTWRVLAATISNQISAYICGGQSPTIAVTSTDLFNCATEMTALSSYTLPTAVGGAVATYNPATGSGFIMGGCTTQSNYQSSGSTPLTTAQKFDFALGVFSLAPAANLTIPRKNAAQAQGVASAYIAGGITNTGGFTASTNLVDKLDYITEITAAAPMSATISINKSGLSGLSSSAFNAAYFTGGFDNSSLLCMSGVTDKIDGMTDVGSALLTGQLQSARAYCGAVSN